MAEDEAKELAAGDMAPDFTLSGDSGAHSLRDYRGRNVVLYFYPADDTPGCTTEACEFRDMDAQIKAAGAEILGISPDDPKSHRKFAEKYNLPFTLLSDEDHAVAELYNAWKLKKNYGREYMGIDRSTFLIGPDGRIRRVWHSVKAQGHAAAVYAELQPESATKQARLGITLLDS